MTKIGIISAKGGVGKTAITINLSAALNSLNKNSIALDADVRMSGLSLQLGMYRFPVTLNDVLAHGNNILEALYIHSTGLRIIPASLYSENISIPKLEKSLREPSLANSIILIDSPPGLEASALAIPRICDEIVIVTLPEIPSVVNALKNIQAATNKQVKIRGIIVNRYLNGYKEQVRPEEIESVCGVPVIGIIPEDRSIRKSIFRRIPSFIMDPYSPSSIEFGKIASIIAGEKYKKPKNYNIKRILRRLGR